MTQEDLLNFISPWSQKAFTGRFLSRTCECHLCLKLNSKVPTVDIRGYDLKSYHEWYSHLL